MIKVFVYGDSENELTEFRKNFEGLFLTTVEPFEYDWKEPLPRSDTMCSYELEEVKDD